MTLLQRLRLPLALVAFAIVYGTVGYVVLEHWSVLDALYMTVITLTTIGFLEVEPLDAVGRAFTLSIIAFGLIAAFTAVTAIANAIATGELRESMRRRRMRQRIEALDDHYVICGYGRVGRAAADELTEASVDVVVVDSDPSVGRDLEERGIAHIIGDATDDGILRQAGVEKARGLVAAIGSDATNVYITLSARSLNEQLFIVTRASGHEAAAKLTRAGANRVASPYLSIGRQMAFLALRPAVVDFVDHLMGTRGQGLEEVVVGDGSALAGVKVADVPTDHPGVTVLAVRKREGDLVPSPGPDVALEHGDLVILLGPQDALADLARVSA